MSVEKVSCQRCGSQLGSQNTEGLCPRCLMDLNFNSQTMPQGEEATAMPPLSLEELAQYFPQFEILECLGRGGMGVVYKARQKTLERTVALKLLAGEWQGDTGFAERFEKEAKILAQMSHTNIVTIHDFGEVDGHYFIVMEFVDGVNLRDLLRDGKMAPEQALAIVPPICEALEYAHEKGIVHRDIKPENLLLDREGRVKIADFGIASLVGSRGEKSGTPAYMAPEQEEGNVDRRADIYALGVVLYEMLTGERPTADFVSPSQKVSIDVRIDEMVVRALEKEPELRYQTAGEFGTVAETMVSVENRVVVREHEILEKSKLSKTAIFGAILTGFGVVGLWGSVLAVFLYTSGILLGRPSKFEEIVLATSLVSLFPLVIGSVLGWVSMSQIRHSEGRLHGGGLSFFASLPFSLFVLDRTVIEKQHPTVEDKIALREKTPRRLQMSKIAILSALVSGLGVFGVIAMIVVAILGTSSESIGLREIVGSGIEASLWLLAGTILGLISISKIRHSGGRLYGQEFAFFATLPFSILFLNSLIFLLFPLIWAFSSTQFGYQNRPIFLGVTLTLIVVVDIVLVRFWWRVVTGKRGVERDEKASHFMGYAAFFFGILSGLIPTLFYWLRPWAAPWLTDQALSRLLEFTAVAAVAAVLAGFFSKKHWWGLQGLIMGSFSLVIWLCFFFAGQLSQPKSSPGKPTLQVSDQTSLPSPSSIDTGLEAESVNQPLRFVPDKANKHRSSWMVQRKASALHPEGWSIRARLAIDTVARPTWPGDEEPFLLLRLLDGNEDWIKLEIRDVVENRKMTISLKRGEPGSILADGKGYRVLFPNQAVAKSHKGTTPFATVLITEENQVDLNGEKIPIEMPLDPNA